MPEDNKNNEGGDSSDAAAKEAADKAATDAAATATEDGSGDGSRDGDGEETVTLKKSELDQIKSDRDNYKTGLLGKKADERSLHEKKDDKGDGTGDGTGDGAGDATVIDEKKITDTVTAATNKVLRDASEKTAKRAFLKAHPEYVDDVQWTALMSHLYLKGTELTHDEVNDRMEAALFEHKRSTGKLEEHLKSEHERGVREGRIQGEIGSGHGTGGAGDKNEKTKGTLTPRGEEITKRMHNDPDKIRNVDISKDNVIDVTITKK